MFDKAKVLSNAAPTTKGKKKEREKIQIKNLEKLAHLDSIIKLASTAKSALEAELAPQIRTMFLERTAKDGTPPESFDGVDGLAEANIQQKKRSSASALNEDERAAFEKAKIKVIREVITPELFAINPAYAADLDMLRQVEKSLKKLDLPEDFFVKQEEKVKYIVDDTTIEKALKSRNQDLINMSTILAIKPTLTETRTADLMATFAKAIEPKHETPTAEPSVAPAWPVPPPAKKGPPKKVAK